MTATYGDEFTGRLIRTPTEFQEVPDHLSLLGAWGLTSPAHSPERVVEQLLSSAPPEGDGSAPTAEVGAVVDSIVEAGQYDGIGRFLLDPVQRDSRVGQALETIDDSRSARVEEAVVQRTGFDPDVRVPLGARIVSMGEELARLQDIRQQAVADRMAEYERTSGIGVTLDPESLRWSGDRIRFKVVRTSALDDQGNIPEDEARIPLEEEVTGLGAETHRVNEAFLELAAENQGAAHQAWAAFIGARRRQSATVHDPQRGLVPADPPDPIPTLSKAKGAAKARTLVVDATAALSELLTENQLSADWIPALETLERTDTGFEIRFFNKNRPSESRLITTDDDRIARLKTFMDENLDKEAKGFKGKTAEGEVEGDSPDALNSAFIVQFLVGLARDAQDRAAAPSASGVLATALEVHRWVFVSQIAFGGIMDTVKIASIIKTLLKSGDESLAVASKTSQALSYAGEAVGAGFMAANLILDSIQLAHADNDVQRAVFGTQIAFDSLGVVLSGAGLGTTITANVAGSLAGSAIAAGDAAAAATAGSVATVAGTVGSLVGGAGVILAGLGIGAAALAQNYSIIADEAKSIGKYFQNLDDAYKKGGFLYDTEDGISRLTALSGAVITGLDFRTDRVNFGSQYISQTTHGSTGSGKQDYFFWIGDFPTENTEAELTIRSELGYADAVDLENGDTELVVLPATPEVHFSGLEWQTLPGATGRNDAGFDVLRKLENNKLFDYDFYIFPSEYIIHKFDTIDYRVTDVNIRLDGDDRTLLMPDIPSDQLYKMHYNLYGNGGVYTLAANEGSIAYLRTDGNTPSTWIIDATNLDSDTLSFANSAISVGGYQFHASAARDHYLVVNHDRDLYQVDVAARTYSLLSVNARGHGAGLMAFLRNQRFPGRFLEVTQYQVNWRDVGKAWYDKETHSIRYVEINNVAFTQNLDILDVIGNDIFFSAEVDGKLEIWKVNAATRRVTHRYAMVSAGSGVTQRVTGIWKLGGDIVFEQTQTASSGTIKRRYRLSGNRFSLSGIQGDDALISAWQGLDVLPANWGTRILPPRSGAITWTGQTATESIPVSNSYSGYLPYSSLGRFGSTPPIYTPTHYITREVSYSGVPVPAQADAWLSLVGSRSRIWVHRDTREVVVPGMAHIPDDLMVIGLDNSLSPKLALFYSPKMQKVYRQEGNRFNDAETRLERIKNGDFNSTANWRFNGDTQVFESMARLVNGGISQQIEGLHRGTHYTLRFRAGGPSGATGGATLVVLWNGNEVGRIDGSSAMADQQILLVADQGGNQLSFKVVGDSTTPSSVLLDGVSLKARPVIEYDGIQNLFSLGSNPVFETLTGEIRRLESSGDTQLTGVTRKWLDAHSDRTVTTPPDTGVLADQTSHATHRPPGLTAGTETTEQRNWRADLRRLVAKEGLDSEPVIAVQGIETASGNVVAAWYDVDGDRFVFAPAPQRGALLYLGLTADKSAAVLHNSDTGQMLSVTLFADDSLGTKFGNDRILEDGVVLPTPQDLFADAGLTFSGVVPFDGNQYLVTFTQGLAFLVGKTTQPKLAAVLDSWSGSRADLTALFGRWAHEPVVRLFRQGSGGAEIQNWWVSALGKWTAISGRNRNDVEWIGTNAGNALLFDKTQGELIRVPLQTTAAFTSAPAGVVIDRVDDMRRLVGETDTLYVQLNSGSSAPLPPRYSPPLVDGVKALYLTGGSGAEVFSITRQTWDHYRVIAIDAGTSGGEGMDRVEFGVGIDSGHMGVGKTDDNGLVVWDTESGAQLILSNVFDPDPQIRARYHNIQVKFADTAPIPVTTLASSVVGAGGGEVLRTGDTDNTVRGGDGNDRIYAGGGRDIIHGQAGHDDIHGGSGDDVIVGGPGADTIFGDEGEDTLVFRGDGTAREGVNVDLGQGTGGGADAQGDIYIDVEHVNGTAYADVLAGNEMDNRLSGGEGNDILDGRGGRDELHAGSGRNQLTGGEGEDTYVFDQDGDHTIQNQARDGKTDLIRMNALFNAIAALRSGNDLVITASATFSVRVLGFFRGAEFRHIRVVSSDGILFEIAEEDFNPGTPQLTKTVIGLDRSHVAGDLLWNATTSETFANSRVHLSRFLGSATHGNTLEFGNEDITVKTGAQSDMVTTGSGNDLVDSGGGADTITAGEGNDIIRGGAGADEIRGGGGSDTVSFDGDPDTETGVIVDLTAGTGRGADAQGDGYQNVENVDGTPFDDVLYGSLVANVLSGRGGNDRLYGGFDNDILAPGTGSDRVDGGLGWDTVRYGDLEAGIWLDLSRGITRILDIDGIPTGYVDHLISIENVEGTAFADMIMGDHKDNLVLGTPGHDRIDLGDGRDRVDYTGMEGDRGVWIDLNEWNPGELPLISPAVTGDQDYLLQWIRNVEELRGSGNPDRLYGSDQADTLFGGSGSDLIHGRGGDDVILGSGQGDTIDGGEGEDTLDYRNMGVGIHASLSTGIAAALDRFSNIENLTGSLFDDELQGDDGANVLYGHFGLDVLTGNGGDDTFLGLGDGDLMIGGSGQDTADFRKAVTGVQVTMSRSVQTPDQRRAWEALENRPDFLVGIETVLGSNYHDLISTDQGNEVIRAGAGDDRIMASSNGYGIGNPTARFLARLGILHHGQDTLDGGEGFDVVSYLNTRRGILANLGMGNASRDTLISIEGIQGSRYADTIYGSDQDNLFIAGNGGDFYHGGAGTDTADYGQIDNGGVSGILLRFIESGSTRRPANIGSWNSPREAFTQVSFSSGGQRFIDEHIDVEVFRGTARTDNFTGGSRDETFMGEEGNDILTGRGGNDRLEGGEDNDVYLYRNGDGRDAIFDSQGTMDRLILQGFSRPSDIVVWGQGEDLKISSANGGEVTIEKGMNQANGIEHIHMGRSVITHSAALQLVDAMARFAADNSIVIDSAQDIRGNTALMGLAASAWQTG